MDSYKDVLTALTQAPPAEPETAKPDDYLALLVKELNDQAPQQNITKMEALAKQIVSSALEGDQRMIAHILKVIEKVEPKAEASSTPAPLEQHDWQIIYDYYTQYFDPEKEPFASIAAKEEA